MTQTRTNYRKAERRHDWLGEIRWMAEAEGYVMCRRPQAMPIIMSKEDWDRLPTNKPKSND